MHIEEVLDQHTINLDLEAETKIDAIEKLADMLYANDCLFDKDEFVREAMDREKTEPTDFGIGIAIPHGMSSCVKRACVAIGRLKKPISWSENSESSEHKVSVVFLLASSPDDKGRSHMEIISKIAALLIEDDFVDLLHTTDSKTGLLDAINTHLGENYEQ
jgi:fructose-specific phosphotransferase system IIA component